MARRISLTQDSLGNTAGGANLNARACTLKTPHGVIQTPIFMPVGTAGTVKSLTPEHLKQIGAQIILGNTYHLWLRPGIETLQKVGGLRKWMAWDGPLLTDSGGFQVFSLSKIRKIKPEGVEFKSHLDGSKLFLSPEKSIEVQQAIASTIMMVLDVCPALPATRKELLEAMAITSDWARRCLSFRSPKAGALFGIVQGGLEIDLRLNHLDELQNMSAADSTGELQTFDGLALGGFSVGEDPAQMAEALELIAPKMPQVMPRYLMGVGTPTDILNAIGSGMDMFDCVMPTRNARNGHLFTSRGIVRIRNSRWTQSTETLDPACACYTCKNFTLSYLRHLYNCKEMLAATLGSIHNLAFYLNLAAESRQAILEGRFAAFKEQSLRRWRDNQEVLDP